LKPRVLRARSLTAPFAAHCAHKSQLLWYIGSPTCQRTGTVSTTAACLLIPISPRSLRPPPRKRTGRNSLAGSAGRSLNEGLKAPCIWMRARADARLLLVACWLSRWSLRAHSSKLTSIPPNTANQDTPLGRRAVCRVPSVTPRRDKDHGRLRRSFWARVAG